MLRTISTSRKKNKKRMTKGDFERQLIREYSADVKNREAHPVHKSDLRLMARLVFSTLSSDMVHGWTVPITGFAVFGSTRHKGREVKDPQGHKHKSKAHRYPHIRPYRRLKDEVKHGYIMR